MKIERLRNKKSKLIFLCGFLVVVILLITLVFKGSKAKYRNSNIIPLINTKVKNNVPDFTTVGIYLENSTGTEVKNGKKYQKEETIPSSGYVINETNSYCTKFNSATNTSEEVTKTENPELKLYTDMLGSHSIKGIKKGYKCYIYFDKGTNKYISAKSFLLNMWGYEDISTITERPVSDFTGETKVTISGRDTANNRDWLYKAPDDDGTSYYLAGNPKYNWVKFGGHYWRIVRINGDGTVRMIYSGSSKPEESGTGTKISTITYNTADNRALYVGYWYADGQLHGKTTPSQIYTEVNNFYENNLKKYDSYIDKNAGFCNDRTLRDEYSGGSGFDEVDVAFGAQRRIHSNPTGPILTCPVNGLNGDLFTAEGATKGNKILKNPIGLITVDEAVFAGLLYHIYGENTDNYLLSSIGYFTMTPGYKSPYCTMYVVSLKGVTYSYVYSEGPKDVRPVINLIKNITFSQGDGSKEHPFEV